MLALQKTAPSYDFRVRPTIFGNALGNSIVDGLTPQPLGITADQYDEMNRQLSAEVRASQAGILAGVRADNAIALSLNKNPEFLANLPVPTAEFETDVFDGRNPFAGARLVNSYDDAVGGFDQRFLAGIDAAARAPQRGLSIQFDPAYQDQQAAAIAARGSPAALLGMSESEYGRLARPTDAGSSVVSTVGKYTLGGTETLLGGVYNTGVRIAGGVASIPYALFDSVDAGVAVQEGFPDRYGYDLRSPGAQDIGAALQPVGQYVQSNVLNPLRSYSETYIGDAVTTTLFAGAQAGVEIGGLLLGGGAVGRTTSGLRTANTISPERAIEYLVKRQGFDPADAKSYIATFDGPITARIARPGEDFLRYTGKPNSSGDFLTKYQFANAGDAKSGLHLGPYGNPATFVQSVSSVRSSIVFDGAITNGWRGVDQTLAPTRTAFSYGIGRRY